jgi:hypothetical protein
VKAGAIDAAVVSGTEVLVESVVVTTGVVTVVVHAAPVVALKAAPAVHPETLETAGHAAPVAELKAAPAAQPFPEETVVVVVVVGSTVIPIELLEL